MVQICAPPFSLLYFPLTLPPHGLDREDREDREGREGREDREGRGRPEGWKEGIEGWQEEGREAESDGTGARPPCEGGPTQESGIQRILAGVHFLSSVETKYALGIETGPRSTGSLEDRQVSLLIRVGASGVGEQAFDFGLRHEV